MTGCLLRISRSRVRRLLEGVASAAHSADRIAVHPADQGLAQPPHVHVDRAPVDEGVASPYAVEKLLALQHAAGVFHEEGQQLELRRAEPHFPLAAGYPVGRAVERNVAGAQDIGYAARYCAPQ